jgi:hypothetical protein
MHFELMAPDGEVIAFVLRRNVYERPPDRSFLRAWFSAVIDDPANFAAAQRIQQDLRPLEAVHASMNRERLLDCLVDAIANRILVAVRFEPEPRLLDEEEAIWLSELAGERTLDE